MYFRARVEPPSGLRPSQGLRGRVVQELVTAVSRTQLEVLNRARDKIRVKTGAARRSLTADDPVVTSDGSVSGAVGAGGAGAPHARWLELGTGIYSEDPGAPHKPIIIVPKNAKALRWPRRGYGPSHPVTTSLAKATRMHLGPAGGPNLRLSGNPRTFVLRALQRGQVSTSQVYAFAQRVVQLGNKPQPYLRPALAESQEFFQQEILGAITRALFGGK